MKSYYHKGFWQCMDAAGDEEAGRTVAVEKCAVEDLEGLKRRRQRDRNTTIETLEPFTKINGC